MHVDSPFDRRGEGGVLHTKHNVYITYLYEYDETRKNLSTVCHLTVAARAKFRKQHVCENLTHPFNINIYKKLCQKLANNCQIIVKHRTKNYKKISLRDQIHVAPQFGISM